MSCFEPRSDRSTRGECPCRRGGTSPARSRRTSGPPWPPRAAGDDRQAFRYMPFEAWKLAMLGTPRSSLVAHALSIVAHFTCHAATRTAPYDVSDRCCIRAQTGRPVDTPNTTDMDERMRCALDGLLCNAYVTRRDLSDSDGRARGSRLRVTGAPGPSLAGLGDECGVALEARSQQAVGAARGRVQAGASQTVIRTWRRAARRGSSARDSPFAPIVTFVRRAAPRRRR
jgi:hypothetical protein